MSSTPTSSISPQPNCLSTTNTPVEINTPKPLPSISTLFSTISRHSLLNPLNMLSFEKNHYLQSLPTTFRQPDLSTTLNVLSPSHPNFFGQRTVNDNVYSSTNTQTYLDYSTQRQKYSQSSSNINGYPQDTSYQPHPRSLPSSVPINNFGEPISKGNFLSPHSQHYSHTISPSLPCLAETSLGIYVSPRRMRDRSLRISPEYAHERINYPYLSSGNCQTDSTNTLYTQGHYTNRAPPSSGCINGNNYPQCTNCVIAHPGLLV